MAWTAIGYKGHGSIRMVWLLGKKSLTNSVGGERISMATENYGEDFRSIGQALEAKDIRSFELKRLGDWYVLQGVPPGSGSLRSKVHKFKLRFRRLSDVEELSRQGKTKRLIPGRMPNFGKLSNALRTIGLYLESKQAKFSDLQVRPLTITLSYKDSDGQQQIEDRTIRSFHSLSLDFYEKRAQGKGDAKAQQAVEISER